MAAGLARNWTNTEGFVDAGKRSGRESLKDDDATGAIRRVATSVDIDAKNVTGKVENRISEDHRVRFANWITV